MVYIEHEEFLTQDDFIKIGQEISSKELEQIDGHPLGDNEEINIKKEIQDEDIIGKTPTGMPIHKNDDPGEIYRRIPNVEEISILNKDNLNKNYLAFVRTESLDLIKSRFKIEAKDSELVKRLVVFKSHTFVFLDKFEAIHLGGDDILAIKNENIDKYECPFDNDQYTYLGNLTNDADRIKRKHTTVIDSKFKHPVNFPIGRTFFAKTSDAIETKISIKDRNGTIFKN